MSLHDGGAAALTTMVVVIVVYAFAILPTGVLALPGGLALRMVANGVGQVPVRIGFGDGYKGALLVGLAQVMVLALAMVVVIPLSDLSPDEDVAGIAFMALLVAVPALLVAVPAWALRRRMPWAFGGAGGGWRALLASLAVLVVSVATGALLSLVVSRFWFPTGIGAG